ncbi:MAG TPA: hypothetical protein IAB89_00210 [Candidatus Caccousia avicola]|uniref:Uncharacterized protein n=1 Tax=Candidatus Caccousia avicola TaxID=2840721 RepID=A0A9D1AKJ0_9FIRM|nr:hypothetical protein [Candidatus Caccousia avicola]
MEKMTDGKRRLRAFLTAFVVTLCALAFAMGFLEVDARSRQVGFGDENTLLNSLTGQNWQLPW